MSYTLHMVHVINTFNDELYHMINATVTITNDKFTVSQYTPFIRATNSTVIVYAFTTSISGNQKQISGSFTTDAFAGFTTPFNIQFGIGQEVLGSFDNVTTAAIQPLDPLFADVVVPNADNAWLETILIS
jgi:hypothetical protein